MHKWRTLRGQLLLWLSVPLLALWIISAMIDHDIAKDFVNLSYDRVLLDTAHDLGRSIRESNNRLYLDLPKPVIEMLITGEQGRFFYRANGPSGAYISGDPDLPDPPPEAQTGRVTYYNASYHGAPIRAVAVRIPVQPGSGKGAILIQVAERAATRTESTQRVLLRMMFPQSIMGLLVLLAVWVSVGLGLRPLTRVRQEITNRSHLDLSPLNDQKAPSELQPLIKAMNELLARLGIALTAQQRFIADAAHQLRTPVAAMKTQIELAVRQVGAGEAQATLQQLHTAADHATHLVAQLLTLARAEPGSHRSLLREPMELCALTRETASEWVPRALARHIDLGFDDASDRAKISADPFLIREMLNNLIDNAIRYTPDGGHVTLRISRSNGTVALAVEDNGPGIPEAKQEKVFERFYRISGSHVEGCGLGLAIVYEIAQGHSAIAAITAGADGHGTRVIITFPLLQ